MSRFPDPRPDRLWLTEGGIETEIMYKWGQDLPHFAVFPLLENPASRTIIRDMYRRYLDVVAQNGMAALIGGFDYRASPDWGALLGYSAEGLAEANLGAIAFLKEMAHEYRREIPEACIVGYVGPRGDAYRLNQTMSAAQATDYHAVQLATLKRAEVDLAWAMTFNNPVEAAGVVAAAKALDVPIAVSFSLASDSRLSSGYALSEAVERLDRETDAYPAFYAVNCSHPIEFEPALTPGSWITRIRSIRPNAAKMDKIALCKLGHLEEGDPVALGHEMASVAARYPHMDIWGGCCGTCERHLDEIARRVREVRATAASTEAA
ncbi:homocysteine S-methyltransferase family protein [Acuticoccus kandeliae]|uniref:homocysteine S-methyltransferase family protein n=1 Tax=Acuticoccus kandeliae TaxID=2073160 RepID=UPI000D3E716B|nr:homocysteine S-methyltransferase family protein [Acuticoccus kandeliae]